MAYSVDPDPRSRPMASDLYLHYLIRPLCPNTKCKFGMLQSTKGRRNDDIRNICMHVYTQFHSYEFDKNHFVIPR